MSSQDFFVYFLTNPRHTVLYIGVTNDAERRANDHSLHRGSAFATKYNATRLIYFEAFLDAAQAISREKQLKGWTRVKKEALIARANPAWIDQAEAVREAR